MRDSDPADEAWTFKRRSALKLTAGLVAAGTFAGSAAAGEGDEGKTVTTTTYQVKQGDDEFDITPLSGDVPVEELYDYRLPDQYRGDGETASGERPYYRSLGTESLQRNATSIMFLYDGPDGLSLVVVHDALDGDGGGSVTWEVTNVPEGVDWLVKDDYYVRADSGESVDSNYDNWETGGSDHTIDWTWMDGRTDGGVLGRFGGDFSLTVHPAFNENAALYGEQYDGKIEDWEVLSGDLDSPERYSLDLDAAVTVSCTTETKKGGNGENGDGTNGDEKKSEEEKRREEIAEKQSEVEKEIEQRRKEMEEEIEQKRKDIEEGVETRKADIESEAEKRQEEIADDVESGGDKDHGHGNDDGGGKPDSVTDVSERFKSDESWNSSNGK